MPDSQIMGGSGLFDPNLEDWLQRPEQAFEHWLAMQGFRASTATVYGAMWRKWLRWTGERKLALPRWQAHHIGEFLDDGGLEKRHRYRYARLIERVFHHLQHIQAASHNPASRAVRERLAEGDNDPTAFLAPAEIEHLIILLQVPDGRQGAHSTRVTDWKASRDAALVAVFLGAGLKVGEARALTLEALAPDCSKITVPRGRQGQVRQAVVLPFAAGVLRHWVALRATAGTQGGWLFPANITGRAMHAASIYRRIEHWLDGAGILSTRRERASPQTLRNSHGALLIEQDLPPQEIASQLGMRDVASGWRLVQAYRDWQARLAGHPPARAAE
ncbi:tyrosine-type recombinase/integrase [Imbroritus primus]|uniref:tyrosine-type recombinase/integrase n=1 Tax=Imbroritus primus TaxID=3058603 RepID=UPI003D160921